MLGFSVPIGDTSVSVNKGPLYTSSPRAIGPVATLFWDITTLQYYKVTFNIGIYLFIRLTFISTFAGWAYKNIVIQEFLKLKLIEGVLTSWGK